MKNVGVVSAILYTGGSVIAAALFLLGTLRGSYTPVERFGGAGWVFLLSMIILMPVVIPAVKKRLKIPEPPIPLTQAKRKRG